MNQSISPKEPGLTDNFALFESVFKLACDQAQVDQQSTEIVLVQLIYHATCELLYSDIPRGHVLGVVEAAAVQVAQEYAEVESQDVGGAA